jgi:hypothetical protein
MSTTFEDAQVGDRVWSVSLGHGVVVDSIDIDPNYPLVIKFTNFINTISYTLQGQEFLNESQTLFWQEIKFEAPSKPPIIKHVYNVEPDNQNRVLFWQEIISEAPEQSSPNTYFRSEIHRYYYYPSLDLVVCDKTLLEDSKPDDLNVTNTCYPCTPEGRKAALLHIKTLLGIK